RTRFRFKLAPDKAIQQEQSPWARRPLSSASLSLGYAPAHVPISAVYRRQRGLVLCRRGASLSPDPIMARKRGDILVQGVFVLVPPIASGTDCKTHATH